MGGSRWERPPTSEFDMSVPRWLSIPTLFGVSLITLAPAQAQRLPDTGFTVGEPFPTVAFPSLEDGRSLSIADFRGKKLLLHVFASW